MELKVVSSIVSWCSFKYRKEIFLICSASIIIDSEHPQSGVVLFIVFSYILFLESPAQSFDDCQLDHNLITL